MKGLLIGRFQPVHNGHVDLMQQVDKLGLDEIVLGIGSNLDGRTPKNPFFYDEVREMWLPILENISTPTEIYRIPDINSPKNYAQHVENMTSVNKDNIILISGNPNTVVCFPDYECVTLKENVNLHASIVRNAIKEKKPWKQYLPESSINLVDKIGEEKVRSIIEENNDDKPIYNGHIKVVQRPYDGKDWDVVVSKNACAIMYIDLEDNVWFTKQYRVALDRTILELPAETMDKEGKSSLQVIVEGLEEECGIQINTSQVHYFLTIESSGGHDTEMVDLFYASGNHVKTQQRLEDDEKIDVVKIPFNDAYGMVLNGLIQGSKTVSLLQNEYIRRLNLQSL